MYAEIYSLGANTGYTFPCKGISLCGETLRVQSEDGDWYFVDMTGYGDVRFHDRTWTDFGVSDKPFEMFKLITFRTAKKWLERQ